MSVFTMLTSTIILITFAVQAVSQDRCYSTVTEGGARGKSYIGDRACIDFAPARQITGIWIDEFEGSAFYEGAKNLDDVRKREDRVWLTIDKKSAVPAKFKRMGSMQAYRLTFVGRFARDMKRKPIEGYGHFGMSNGLVLVDRLLSWEDLGRVE